MHNNTFNEQLVLPSMFNQRACNDIAMLRTEHETNWLPTVAVQWMSRFQRFGTESAAATLTSALTRAHATEAAWKIVCAWRKWKKGNRSRDRERKGARGAELKHYLCTWEMLHIFMMCSQLSGQSTIRYMASQQIVARAHAFQNSWTFRAHIFYDSQKKSIAQRIDLQMKYSNTNRSVPSKGMTASKLEKCKRKIALFY